MTSHSVPTLALPQTRWRLLALLKDVLIGGILASNPVTAVFVLGWSVRRMRWIAGAADQRPGWLISHGERGVRWWLSGLVANTREGVSTASALFLATLPFTALWSLAWWAGWNNSFTKGYEDAIVGPLLSLLAITIALPIIALLPMALAHRTIDGRWSSLFHIRTLLQLTTAAGWRYGLLSVLWAFMGFAILAWRMLPGLGDTVYPGLADLQGQDLTHMREILTLAQGMTIFIAVLILHGASARLYGKAKARLTERRSSLIGALLCWLILLPAAFLVVAQIYMAQFFNYDSFFWFSHPLLVLPGAT